jgi:hypothetical protein
MALPGYSPTDKIMNTELCEKLYIDNVAEEINTNKKTEGATRWHEITSLEGEEEEEGKAGKRTLRPVQTLK